MWKQMERESETDRMRLEDFTAVHLSISGPSHLPSCPSSASPLF